MKYILYARKSSESEDRQIQSIDDQVNRLKKIAKELKLHIIDIYTESKSAKQPYVRAEFIKLMNAIEEGKAEGILCWQINRITRNPVDSGQIQWLLQKNILKSIQTVDREYLPQDNTLLFSLESGIANQYIIDLRKNTLRGIQSKLDKGWMPNMAPIGYINNKEEKTICEDPDRFDLIRKMWEMMLTGLYTPPKILDVANNQWALRSRKTKRNGNRKISRSTIYNIFTNIFYTGMIEYDGKEFQGKHKAMITFTEFDHVQILLGRKEKASSQKHQFTFTGLIRCEECGCLYTAETKTKYIKSTGKIRKYTYYHCTRKKRDIVCSQKTSIRKEELERQILLEIENLTILPEFRDWALQILNKENDREIEIRTKIHKAQVNDRLRTQKEMDNLTKMRYRDMITDIEYLKERKELQLKIQKLRESLKNTEDISEHWLDLTEKTFHFATHARESFISGNNQTKKEILLALGSNPNIKDGKLKIQTHEWLVPIKKAYGDLKKKYERLESKKLLKNKGDLLSLEAIRTNWLPGLDSNQQPSG